MPCSTRRRDRGASLVRSVTQDFRGARKVFGLRIDLALHEFDRGSRRKSRTETGVQKQRILATSSWVALGFLKG